MLKLIKSDLYKVYHRPYLYVLTSILAFLVVFMNMTFLSSAIGRKDVLSQMYQFLFLPLFFVSMFVDVTTAEEFKHGTLKNTISFGVNRTQLYISKLITASITGLVTAIITVAALVGSAYLFIKPDAGFTDAFMMDFLMRIGTAFVLYIGAVALGSMLAVLLKKSSAFAVVFAALLFIPTMLFLILGSTISPVFLELQKLTLLMQCYGLQSMAQSQLPTAVLIGVAHYLIFAVLGVYIFNRQEIN